MLLYNTLEELGEIKTKTAVALGTFDGVHIGHQAIIKKAVEWAKKQDAISVVFTFRNHPLSVIAPDKCPQLILPEDSKAKYIENLGVDILLNVPFENSLLSLSPQEFISFLKKKLRPGYVVVGPNYSFGYRGAGTPELLQETGYDNAFEVEIHPAIQLDGKIVSSTAIRQLLNQGDILSASKLLGRNYIMHNMTVSHGQQRGRKLGFPTANLEISSGFVVPRSGVYIVKVLYDSRFYPGVANVGNNPTFGDLTKHIEVHILDFAEIIYGEKIDLFFCNRLREELRFEGPELLIKQITADIAAARKYFNNTYA